MKYIALALLAKGIKNQRTKTILLYKEKFVCFCTKRTGKKEFSPPHAFDAIEHGAPISEQARKREEREREKRKRERKKRGALSPGKKQERENKGAARQTLSLSPALSSLLSVSLSRLPLSFPSRAPPHRVAHHRGPGRPLALHRPQPDLLLQLPVGRERRDRLARAVVEQPGLGEDAEPGEAEEGRCRVELS